MKKASNRKGSNSKNYLERISSPRIRPFIFLIIILILLYIFKSRFISWGAGLQDTFLSNFGIGTIFLIALILFVLILWWKSNLTLLWKRINWWLGSIAFTMVIMGIASFFKVGEGAMREATLGGHLGIEIAGSYYIITVFRLILLTLIGLLLISPRLTWRLLVRTAGLSFAATKKILSILGFIFRRCKAFYSVHPIHKTIGNLVIRKEQKIPEAETGETVEEAPGEETPAKQMVNTPAPKEKKKAVDVQKKGRTIPFFKGIQLPLKPVQSISFGRWEVPSIDLLDSSPQVEFRQADVERTARMIEEALGSYGVEAKVTQINVGPTVTQFGIEPGWDHKYKEIKEKDRNGNIRVHTEEVSRTRVKVERITSLANDLALALSAPSIRIEAPVPGKPVIGIEVPNTTLGLVALRSVLEGTNFQKFRGKTKLALALGKGPGGEGIVADLTKMPHLLIAGQTGSGKTVCLNAIITCLLMCNTPDDLRLILVDPKRVEMVSYNGIPHLNGRVIVDGDAAVQALVDLNKEMDRRFRQIAVSGSRNIESHNKSGRAEKGLPYIVLIVDELADLMMSRPEEVEPNICRLAQLARATGIHLIIATQRPSVDVVTGLIKANFPTRISFAVVSQVDSRTILDGVGAEKLLGKGDMLYLPPEAAKPRRLQGCYVSDAEIDRVVAFWKAQNIPEKKTEEDYVTTVLTRKEGEEVDPYLEEARKIAGGKPVSADFLKRKLKIGLPKAERLVEQLEKERESRDITQSESKGT